jgi:hypothetical protein
MECDLSLIFDQDIILISVLSRFRLAACLLVELRRSNWVEQEELDKTLENLPNDLFSVYDRFSRKLIQKIGSMSKQPSGGYCFRTLGIP